jgi:prepilin signal peptidase PulO-like enzyme (type II secretory pathway)
MGENRYPICYNELMEFMTIYFFILGLILASFLNALAYRIEKNFAFPGIFTKPSHCDVCEKKLTWVELIPVISFFMYRGRCKKCENKIFWYYPLSELILGLTLAAMWQMDISLYFAIPVLLLFFLSYFDMTSNSVPRIFVNVGVAFALLDLLVRFYSELGIQSFYPSLLAVFLGLVLMVVNLFKKSFGFGDILVIFFLSVFLTLTQFQVFLFLVLLLSSAVSLYLVFMDQKWIKRYIPLIPFMYLAYIGALLYSDQIAALFAKVSML